MKLLSKYQSKLSQTKTSLEKYQSRQQETSSENIKPTSKQRIKVQEVKETVVIAGVSMMKDEIVMGIVCN